MHALKIAPAQAVSAAAPTKVNSRRSTVQAATAFSATLRAEWAESRTHASVTMPRAVHTSAPGDESEQRPTTHDQWSGERSHEPATKASPIASAHLATDVPEASRSWEISGGTAQTECVVSGERTDNANVLGDEALQRPVTHGDGSSDQSAGAATKANATVPLQPVIDAPNGASTATEFHPELAAEPATGQDNDRETTQRDVPVSARSGATVQVPAAEQGSSSDPQHETAMHARAIVPRQADADESTQRTHTVACTLAFQRSSATRSKATLPAVAAPSIPTHAAPASAAGEAMDGPATAGVAAVAVAAPMPAGSDASGQDKPERGVTAVHRANNALRSSPARNVPWAASSQSGTAPVGETGNAAEKPAISASVIAQEGAAGGSHTRAAKRAAGVVDHAVTFSGSAYTATSPWTPVAPAVVAGSLRPKLPGATPAAEVSGKGQSVAAPDAPRLEVGVFDDVHGWLRIRAEMQPCGSVSATLAAASGSAHDALKTALPEMARYLQSESVPVHRITVHRMSVDSGAMDGARSQGQSGGDASGQQHKALRPDTGGSPEKAKTPASSLVAAIPQGTTPAANPVVDDAQRGAAAGLQQWLDGLTRVTTGFGWGWGTAQCRSPGWVNVCA